MTNFFIMDCFSKKIHHGSGRGFSLVEVLVSIAVLSILMIVLFDLSSRTADVVNKTEVSLESDDALRLAFDRWGFDLQAALLRQELPPSFSEFRQNDAMSFFSFVPGYDGARKIARISYRVGDRGLERGAQGLDWDTESTPFKSGETPPVDDGNYDLLAEGVVRLVLGYYLNDGTLRYTSPPESWDEIEALLLCVVYVNPKAINQVGWTHDQLSEIASLFPTPDSGEFPLAQWNAIASNSDQLENEGIPLPVATAIEIRQRVYTIR